MKVLFRGRQYNLVITDHALLQMRLRDVSSEAIVEIVQTGKAKFDIATAKGSKYWVYKEFENRKDNLASLSIAIEREECVVITVMRNWKLET